MWKDVIGWQKSARNAKIIKSTMMNDQSMTMLRQSSTWAPGLNFWDSATPLRQCFRDNWISDRSRKYWRLGAISEIMNSQVSSPIADIFHGDPSFDYHENTAEVASPSLKNWAREPMFKITMLRMIGWGHSNLKLFWLIMTYVTVHVFNKVFLKNTLLQKEFVARYFLKVRCINFQGFFEKYLWAKTLY